MERRDLLAANAEIFKTQGNALNETAKRDAKVLVVGNPANTNAYIVSRSAADFPAENISSMIRLDHNRALAQLAAKADVGVGEIEHLVVWGNHSPTMFADWSHATVGGRPLPQAIGDENWYKTTLIPKVAQRGTAIIEARGRVDFGPIEQAQHEGRWDDMGEMLAHAARRLQAGGADGVFPCTNTMHKVAGAIEAALSIPFIHIADPVGEAAQAKGWTRIGLLGTGFTMEDGSILSDRLTGRFGLEVLTPPPESRAIVHRVIHEEPCAGVIKDEVLGRLSADRRRSRGARRASRRAGLHGNLAADFALAT